MTAATQVMQVGMAYQSRRSVNLLGPEAVRLTVELAINLKIAEALGVPTILITRADSVIE
jgi:hypothetical protein